MGLITFGRIEMYNGIRVARMLKIVSNMNNHLPLTEVSVLAGDEGGNQFPPVMGEGRPLGNRTRVGVLQVNTVNRFYNTTGL